MQSRYRTWLAKGLPYLLILIVVAGAISPAGLALEQRLGLELLFRLRGAITPPSDVVVVALTRTSARKLGQSEKIYQWSRSQHAALLNQLTAAGARLVVFDIFFEEARDNEGDAAFSRALQDAGNVLLFSRSEVETLASGNGLESVSIQSLRKPLQRFQDSALASAPLILPKVPARVSRFFWRHPAFQDMPTLPTLAWLRQQDRQGPDYPDQLALQQTRPDPLLNLYGSPRTFVTVEYSDVVSGQQSALAKLKSATVFVGYSAWDQPDQRDGFYTAFTSGEGLDISGVELAATAFANLAADNWIREWVPWQYGILLLIIGMFSYRVTRLLAPVKGGVLILSFGALLTVIYYAAFVAAYLWLPLFFSVAVMIPLGSGMGIWLRSRDLQQQKNRLQWAFGKYLPQEELQRLVAEQGLPKLQDFSNSVCMVTDAQGFSRLSETLTPVELAELMQSYYEAVIPAIRKGGGIISDVAGDGVIALWLHLESGTAWSALQPVVKTINRNIDQFNTAHPGQELPTRIGIHCGEIVLGHFGAMDHHEFRAMGDIINTTSRLEGANKQLGTRVLVSESCIHSNESSLRYLGRYCFVGKNNPLGLFTMADDNNEQLDQLYQSAIHLFETNKSDEAKALLKQLNREFPDDGPTQFVLNYLEQSTEASSQFPAGIISLPNK